jgi:hypothetical protein
MDGFLGSVLSEGISKWTLRGDQEICARRLDGSDSDR